MQYSLNNSLFVCHLRTLQITVASFPRTVLIGKCTFDQFINYVVIDLSDFMTLFKALKKVLQFFCDSLQNFESIEICNHFICETLMSESEPLIKLHNKSVDFMLEMNYVQFNELVFAVSNTILPGLCFRNCDAEFIESLIDADIQALIKLQELDHFIAYFKESKYSDESVRYFRIFKTNFDIIYILHKLKKFCNFNLLPQSFQNVCVK